MVVFFSCCLRCPPQRNNKKKVKLRLLLRILKFRSDAKNEMRCNESNPYKNQPRKKVPHANILDFLFINIYNIY